jgi:large subunit ribosomal protein L35
MPKMKTNKSASKRFRVTPGGKVVYVRSGLRHNLQTKSAKRKRQLSKPDTLSPVMKETVLHLLGRK